MIQDTSALRTEIKKVVKAQEWVKGAELTEQLCRLQPTSGAAWAWRSGCLARLGRTAEALGCARTALSLGIEDPQLLNHVQQLEDSLGGGRPEVTPVEEDSAPPATLVDSRPQEELPDHDVVVSTTTPPSEVLGWNDGELIEGRYVVQGMTRGGMGEVYFVFDQELEIELAVKTPLPETLASSAGRARFLREAEAWIGLGLHPNICSAYYVRSIGGVPRLFVEYVGGGSLGDWMKDHRDSGAVERLDLAVQTATGMLHAHTFTWRDEEGSEHQGIVHRDLKPANVLLTKGDIPRVTDFGLVGKGDDSEEAEEEAAQLDKAGQIDEEESSDSAEFGTETATAGSIWKTVTVGGVAMGTPPYMPPEQWDGAHRANFSADIYAFGCVLYELFCGRRLFVLDPKLRHARPELIRLEWERLHREAEPDHPSTLNRDLDDDLARLMMDCVKKEPEERPSGFEEVTERLREIYYRVAQAPYPRPEPRPGRLLANTLNNRGVSFVTLDQPQRAERAFREALRADPTHFRARYNHALFQWRFGGSTDTEVIKQLDEAVRGGTFDWRDELFTGRLELALGFYDRGAKRCRSAKERSWGAPEANRTAALAMCSLRNDSKTQESDLVTICSNLEAEAEIKPASAEVYAGLAIVYARLGQHDKCRRAIGLAAGVRPELPRDPEKLGAQLIPGQGFRRQMAMRGGKVEAIALGRQDRHAFLSVDGVGLLFVDIERGKVIRKFQKLSKRVRAAALIEKSKTIAVAYQGEPVTVLQAEDGSTVRKLQLHSGHINGLVVSEPADLLLAVGSDGMATAWKIESGERMWTRKAHDGFGAAVAISLDGRAAVSGGRDGVGKVFDPRDGSAQRDLVGHSGEISAVAIDPTGRMFVTAAMDQTLRVWDIDGTCQTVLQGHGDKITFVALSADGERLVSCSAAGGMRLWDLEAGEPLLSMQLGMAVVTGAAEPDLGRVVAAHIAGVSVACLRVKPEFKPGWAVASVVTVGEAEERAAGFSTHMESARQLLQSERHSEAWREVQEARRITGYARVNEAVELSAEISRPFPRSGLEAAWEERALALHKGPVTALGCADSDDRVLTAGSDHRLELISAVTGERLVELSSDGEVNTSVAFSPDGRSAAGGGLDNTVRVWDLESNRRLLALRGHEGRPGVLCWHPGSTLLLSASHDATVRLWDVRSGNAAGVLKGHLGAVNALSVSPDGKAVASGGIDGSIVIWDLAQQTSLGELVKDRPPISALLWDGGGRNLVSVTRDGVVELWDVSNSRALRRLESDGQTVTSADLAPDGRWVIVGSQNGAAALYDLRSRDVVRKFSGPAGGLDAVRFSHDARRLIFSGGDGTIRIWYLDWSPEFREFVDWDERARPIVDLCLAASGTVDPSQTSRWPGQIDEDLLDEITARLEKRGLGWIRRDGVVQKIGSGEQEKEKSIDTQVTTLHTQRKTVLAATPLKRKAVLKGLKIGAVVLLLMVPLVMWLKHRHSMGQVRFDSQEVRNNRMVRMQSIGGPPPDVLVSRANCQPELFGSYLQIFTERTASVDQIAQARLCLAVLADPRAIEPALELLGEDKPGEARRGQRRLEAHQDDVVSLLVHLGDVGTLELERGIRNPDPMIRMTAARTLALRGTNVSIRTLVRHMNDVNPNIRVVSTAFLRDVACCGHLSRFEVIELFEKLARDEDPQVRRNVARGLRVMAGRRARELAVFLSHDEDSRVEKSARRLLDADRPEL